MTTLRRRTNSEREIETRSVTTQRLHFPRDIRNNQVLASYCDMASRDRTGEFMSVVKNKQGRLVCKPIH